LSGIWAFALFPLVDTGNIYIVTGAIAVGLIFTGMQYGPQAAFFTELFSTEVRYSGASLGYQIGAILGGALAPTIAVMLWNTYGVAYVSVYMAIAALATLFCVSRLSETSGNKID
jgi:flagellar biosynthesis protein FliR